jgi:hypothetical protein
VSVFRFPPAHGQETCLQKERTVIDLDKEKGMTLTSAARSLPKPPHISTVWRWVKFGVRGTKLETVVVGGRRYTTREALTRFIAATTASANGEQLPCRTPHQRQRAVEQAEAELAKAGI